MKIYSWILLFLIAVISSVNGQNLPEPMSPPRLVNDFAQIYSESQKSDLEKILLDYNDSTSTQIYVVTLSDLEGYDVSDYAFRLAEKWGIGQKDKNNGVLILIKPKAGNSRGQVYIATGYGLEPILTDARCGRIIDDYMLPDFKQNDYYSGTRSAVMVMIGMLSGQFEADDDESGSIFPLIAFCSLMVFGFIFLLIMAIKKSKGSSGRGGGRGSGSSWSSGGSSFRGSDSGGSSFGGGGGGSFGGGGAGRSW